MAEQEQASAGTTALDVSVVTPKGAIAELRTDAVTAPGKDGEFELLPEHLAFLTALRPGVLTLGERDEKRIYAVGAGFLRVDQGGRVEILVEEALAGEEVDPDPVRTEMSEAKDELDLWNQALDAEYDRIQYRYEWANAQLEAHSRSVRS